MATPKWARARTLPDGRCIFEVGLGEGRKHEVRRICKALGLTVDRLVRTRFGPVALGTLLPGKTRSLTRVEADTISALVADRGGRKHASESGYDDS
jgi:23S rRNA pseudouridine2605 synthase